MRYNWLAALCLPLILTAADANSAPSIVPVRGAPASFADLSARLLPMVVNIATTQTLKPAATQVGAIPSPAG